MRRPRKTLRSINGSFWLRGREIIRRDRFDGSIKNTARMEFFKKRQWKKLLLPTLIQFLVRLPLMEKCLKKRRVINYIAAFGFPASASASGSSSNANVTSDFSIESGFHPANCNTTKMIVRPTIALQKRPKRRNQFFSYSVHLFRLFF